MESPSPDNGWLQLKRIEDITDNPFEPCTSIEELQESTEQKPKKIKSLTHKACMIANCPNTSVTTPEKLFAGVPFKTEKRTKWMEASKRFNLDPKRPYYCCQDHFDLKKDMMDYSSYFCEGGLRRLILKPDVLPHIFVCDYFAHLSRVGRVKILRRLYSNKDKNKLNQHNQ